MINTLDHLTPPVLLNPYYQFSNTNTKVELQHDVIYNQTGDSIDVCIAECDVYKSFNYNSNITTRFKCNFRAYMSDFSVSYNTFDIWSALYEPNILPEIQADIKVIKSDISGLKSTDIVFDEEITDLDLRVKALEDSVNIISDNYMSLPDVNSVLCKAMYNIDTIIKYSKNTEYTGSDYVWLDAGIPYAVDSDFTSDNTGGFTTRQSFEKDIADGKLILVTN